MVSIVDHRGRPASKSTSGRWNAALFIIWLEIAERFAYFGVSSNLIIYLTGPLQESTAAAAAAVNVWSGVGSLSPIVGAIVADSYLGRFRMLLVASVLFVLGLGLLTLSTVLPGFHPPNCKQTAHDMACKPTTFQVSVFYFSLSIVALAQGGYRACALAFGADQFEQNDAEESASRSSFFNWWLFGPNIGLIAAFVFLTYIEENIGWSIGFGICCIVMAISLIIFLLGIRKYRYHTLEEESSFARIGKAILTLVHSWKARTRGNCRGDYFSSTEAAEVLVLHEPDPNNYRQMEEAKEVFRLLPIWTNCLVYAIVFAQSITFFTKQGKTLDTRIGSNVRLPPAALLSIVSIAVIVFIPMYEHIIVPLAKRYRKEPLGITMLQRIGIGMAISIAFMVIAALVEKKRLKTAQEYGLIDQPSATIPMSLWWLVPQYVLYGISNVFTMVGMQEFFYDQVPDALRSIGVALAFSAFGIGSILSGFLVLVIDKETRKKGESWFSDNVNRAHIDYFYWLLAGLSMVGLVIYLFTANLYIYRKKGAKI
ncbi:protein NRT1/ PTR FAMILY 5.10-like isoform X2 [Phalaenopsis equestris]|uniref:protein NRT1/ PTR FAMILY 5.10-like isoform X2 n=1 Tax=Phalaenopsis equestris TaxID=78828 RepID=UPI0009E425CB|nr:protein NRT1/ PTR FAMILY 5.10-like isoform X2 [Phalaenopsis equestris]